jgi:type II secretory pathway component PulM
MNPVTAWWQGREPRERVMLALCGAALLLTGWFLLVLEPLQARETRLTSALAAELELHDWLERQRPRVQAGAVRAVPERLPDGASLLATINASAAESGIAGSLSRVTPTTARGASLNFAAVPYADFMRWLLALDARYGARVERIRMEQGETAGSVNVELAVEF